MPKSRPRDQDIRWTHAFLFCLIAGQIFRTTLGTKAPSHILELFGHFEKRSWGATCLANMYRGLPKVSLCQKKGKPVKTIMGSLKPLRVIDKPYVICVRWVLYRFGFSFSFFPIIVTNIDLQLVRSRHTRV